MLDVERKQRVAVMQPYFFPYLGYFSLIKQVDRFVLLDPVQFIEHGWINRNRILKQNGGWLYIRRPVLSHSHKTLIKDIRVNDVQPWKDRLFSQLFTYKKVAKHFVCVRDLMEEALSGEHETITSLNKATLEAVCRYIGIPAEFEILSNMNLEVEPPTASDEWALNICTAMGNVAEYWNPPGGQDFYDVSKYAAAGIELKFHKVKLTSYDQGRSLFEPGLSIIDVLMFNSPAEVNRMLDDYELF